jgi:hypothetical protein
MFEELTKEAVDELVLKSQPMIDKLQAALTEALNFSAENLIDRLSGAKISITIELPPAKAKPV